MNALTLVFDFNNMALRSMFTCVYSADKNVGNFDTQDECNVMIRKLASDMCYVMRLFNPNRVVIACDSKNPWRCKLYDDIPGETYKGTRQKDETKNWTNIFKSFKEYLSILKKKNIIVSEIVDAEADDLAALWKEKLMDDGDSVVLVSSDKDWLQLLDYNKSKRNFCAVYNPMANKKVKSLFVTQELADVVNGVVNEEISIFDVPNPCMKMFGDVKMKDSSISVVNIDPDSVLIEKIMCGDDGDNVPSFYHFFSPKNGNKMRITPLKCKKICESLNITTSSALISECYYGKLRESIEKVINHEMDDIDMEVRMDRQRKLVELKSSLFPKNIVETFAKNYGGIIDVQVWGTFKNIRMEEVLNGSHFLKDNYKRPKEVAIFSEIDEMEKLFIRTPKLF